MPDDSGSPQLAADAYTCFVQTHVTFDEATNTSLFSLNGTISRNAQCYVGCVIIKAYNVSISPNGNVDHDGLLLKALVDDSLDLMNASEVLSSCKKSVFPNLDECVNVYNYAACINGKYVEKKFSPPKVTVRNADETNGYLSSVFGENPAAYIQTSATKMQSSIEETFGNLSTSGKNTDFNARSYIPTTN